MVNIDNLKFDEKGLIPAIVQDYYTKKVLTLAYMNRESLEISVKEGRTCFYSRSRKKLWRKGEESGNIQHIVCITADCDLDALTVEVVKEGPACHLGTDSCFENAVWVNPEYKPFSLPALYDLIKGRKDNPKEAPRFYTATSMLNQPAATRRGETRGALFIFFTLLKAALKRTA